MSGHSQFQLLRQRRFLPFFATQCFGAFNDNVYRQAIIGMPFWLGVSAEQKTLFATLAPAIFILRSEERREGKGCVRKGRSRGSPQCSKKQNKVHETEQS